MIRHLLLDMDNTLYPEAGGMERNITGRIMRFVADFLRITPEEAWELRSGKNRHFGTALEWLRTDYGFTDVDAFFAAVHPPREIDDLKPDPALRPFLLSLNTAMTVLTNAPRIHADRILRFFNISDIFLNVFDIEQNNFLGKPHPEAYLKAVAASGFSVEETLFLDDSPSYLAGFQSLGGKTALVGARAELPPGLDCFKIDSIYALPEVLRALNGP